MKKEERLHRLMGDIDDGLVADSTRKLTRKGVWMPLTAAAACVALTVGLWQGGVFDPAAPLVAKPDETTSTTEGTTEPTEASTTTTTETSKNETTKTTEPMRSYILIGGEDNISGIEHEGVPSLKDRLVSRALEEKMKEYHDVNAVYQVVVSIASTIEDWEELGKLFEADKDYQSLQKKYEEAYKAGDDKAHEIYSQKHELKKRIKQNFFISLEKERISYAAKYSKTKPISGYGFGLGYYGRYTGYYMELTADAINELVDRGGYAFCLATTSEDNAIGDMWTE